jgi:hypothetical protein
MPDSRSRSPARDSGSAPRKRSRSPRHNKKDEGDRSERLKKKGGSSGFKWKEKRKDTTSTEEEPKHLERGYRKRSPSPRREKISASTSKTAPSADIASVEDKFGIADKFGKSAFEKFGTGKSTTSDKDDTSKPPERAAATASSSKAAAPAPVASGEPMIIVHVNDRLGTKAAIPCLASDPIKLFKAQVAARIGREPHEILLKRQGERPFKDQLTLEDYGVSNGVQLDLEVDTGD